MQQSWLKHLTEWSGVIAAGLALLQSSQASRAQYVPDVSPNQPAETRSETDGEGRYSLSGGLIAPQVTLEVPPGRRGMTPSIGIVYSPGTVNGVLGAGWNLNIGALINRLSATRGLDALEASTNSRYFVDGFELVRLGDGSYRRIQTDFTVFQPVNAPGSGKHLGWTARKDGVTTYYGDREIIASGNERNAVLYGDESVSASGGPGSDGIASGDYPNGWLLSEMEDEFNNRVDYYYTIPPRYTAGIDFWSRQHLIKRIDYGNSTKSQKYSVRFSYVNRDDTRVSYEGGVGRWHTKLLDRIEVVSVASGVETPVARYGFEYSMATNDSQALLTRITRIGINPLTGADAEIVTLRSFQYDDELSDWAEITNVILEGATLSPGTNDFAGTVSEVRTTLVVTDVNSDGLPDIVSLNDGTWFDSALVVGDFDSTVIHLGLLSLPDHRIFLNTGNFDAAADQLVFTYATNLSSSLTSVLGPTVQGSGNALNYILLDINRDGYLDIVKGPRTSDPYSSVPLPSSSHHYEEGADNSVWRGDSAGWLFTSSATPSWLSTWGIDLFKDYQLFDINGDSLPDWVGVTNVLLHTGSTTPEDYFNLSTAPETNPYFVTIDDPVLSDAAGLDTSGFGAWSAGISTLVLRQDVGLQRDGSGGTYPEASTSAYAEVELTPLQWLKRNISYADVNSDGFADRVYTLRFPEEDADGLWGYIGESSGSSTWESEANSTYTQVFFGNGRGEFTPAFYHPGIGSNGRSVILKNKDVDKDGDDDFTFKYYLNRMAIIDMDGSGRADLVQLTKTNSGGVARMATLQNLRDPVHSSLAGGFYIDVANYVADTRYLNRRLGDHLLAVGTDPLHDGAALETFADFDGDGVVDILRSFVDDSACSQVQGCTGVPDTSGVDSSGPTLQIIRSTRTAPQNRLIGMFGPYGGGTTYEWEMSGAAGGGTFIPVPVMSAIINRNGRTEFVYEKGVVEEGRFLGFEKVTKYAPTGWREVLHFHVLEQFPGVINTIERFNAEGWIEETRLFGYENITYDSGSDSWIYGGVSRPYFYPPTVEDVFDFDPVKVESESMPYSLFLTRLMSAGFSGEPASAAVPAANPIYRHSRTEWSWDMTIGKPKVQRDYRDVATPDDSLITTNTYHTYDSTLEVALPHTTEVWTVGNTLSGSAARRVSYQASLINDYVGTEWTRTIRTANPGSALPPIINRRGIDPSTGDVISTTDARDFQSTYAFDNVGRLISVEDAEGNVNQFAYDVAGRLTQQTRSTGLQTEYDYDDLGRMTYHRASDGSPSPAIETRWDHDWGRVGEPATAMIVAEPDGTQTVQLEYFNEHAQLLRRIRGQRQTGLPDTWVNSLTEAYGILSGTYIATGWDYDAYGRLRLSYTPHDIALPTTAILRELDEWGRVTRIQFEDGTEETYTYSLDSINRLDAEGIHHVSTATTLQESAWIGGHPRVRTLYDALGNPIQKTEGDRRIYEYTYDGFNRLASTIGPEVEVLNSGDGSPSLARATTSYEYLATGELAAQIEPDGQRFEFEYDGLGRLTHKRGPSAAGEIGMPATHPPLTAPELSLHAMEDGLIAVEWTAPDGSLFDLEWAESLAEPVEWLSVGAVPRRMGDLRKVILATETLAGFLRLRFWWEPTTTAYASSQLLEFNHYDDRPYPNHRVLSQSEYGTIRTRKMDGWGRTYETVDYDGSITTSSYDLRGRLAQTTLPHGELLTRSYDRHGRQAAVTSTRGVQSATTTFTYDVRGNMLSATDADAVVQNWTYDLRARPTLNTQGVPARESSSSNYDLIGRPVSVREAGRRTDHWFDSRGRMTRQSVGYNPGADIGLVEVSTVYDDLDLPTRTTVGTGSSLLGGGETLRTFDALGQMTSKTIQSHDDVIAQQSSYAYDIKGRLTRFTDGRGVVTRTAYDSRGRPSSRMTFGHGTTSLLYVSNPLDPLDGSRFAGLAIQTEDAEGVATTVYTDSLGRTCYIIAADGTSVQNFYVNGLLTEQRRYSDTCELRGIKRYFYEANSARLRFETEWMTPAQAATCTSAPPCPGVGYTAFTYTSAGRAATVRDPAGNVSSTTFLDDASGLPARSVVGGVTEMAYEYLPGLPRLAAQILDPDGTPIRTQITWERATRIQSLQWTSAGKPQEIIEHDYDEAGLPKQSRVLQGASSTPRVVVTRTWTPARQLALKQYTVEGVPFLPTTWQYALNGQVTHVAYPSLNVAQYEYLPNTYLLERIRLSSGASILNGLVYDRAGRTTAMLLAGSATETHLAATIAYDWAGRPAVRNIEGMAAPGLVRTEGFNYDSAGRLAALNSLEAASSWSVAYNYDHRDMLVQETHSANDLSRPNLQVTYNLNPVTGLRTQRRLASSTTTNVTAMTYGTGNQLATVKGVPISHDAYGRQLNDHRGDNYQWNLRGKLAGIQETLGPAPKTETMQFDPDGQRVLRQYDGAQVNFLLDDHPGRVLHQIGLPGSGIDFVYSPSGQLLAQVSESGQITPVLDSITASPTLVGSSGIGLYERGFDAFGGLLDERGTDNTETDFHGMWATRGSSQLKAAGHRFYDPELGRFLSTDPLGFSGGTGLGRMDLYRYAAQSPTRMKDSTGLSALGISPRISSSVAQHLSSGISAGSAFGERGRYFQSFSSPFGPLNLGGSGGFNPAGPYDPTPRDLMAKAADDAGEQADTSSEQTNNGNSKERPRIEDVFSGLDPDNGDLVADEIYIYGKRKKGFLAKAVGVLGKIAKGIGSGLVEALEGSGGEDASSSPSRSYSVNEWLTSVSDWVLDTQVVVSKGIEFKPEGDHNRISYKLGPVKVKFTDNPTPNPNLNRIVTAGGVIGAALSESYAKGKLVGKLVTYAEEQALSRSKKIPLPEVTDPTDVPISRYEQALKHTRPIRGVGKVAGVGAVVDAGVTGWEAGTFINFNLLPDNTKLGLQAVLSITPLGHALGGAEFWDDPNNFRGAGDRPVTTSDLETLFE